MRLSESVIKRVVDVAGASAGIALLSPVLVAAGVAVWLDSPGPIVFAQSRLGLNGRVFRLLKLRTMSAAAEVEIDARGRVLGGADDPRLTRVGRVLRAWSIDEIPQLVNVLAGEMSLVGPRPDLPEALRYYSANERARLSVKPGITGLSQVSGRNALSPQQKWALDAEYAAQAGLATDMKILFRTVHKVVIRESIYGD